MEIKPIAYFHSPFNSKFGIPKQSGLVEDLEGEIILEPDYRREEALRGLKDFEYVWLIWEFSANPHVTNSFLVRPPLLGGNEKMGVFATRSPFRPNPLGLSCVKISSIEYGSLNGPVIHVLGGDLMDKTPIYDIKPYIAQVDSHPDALSGFVDTHKMKSLQVEIPEKTAARFTPQQLISLRKILELDPRPQYQEDPQKVYGMPYMGCDIHFKVIGRKLIVIEDSALTPPHSH